MSNKDQVFYALRGRGLSLAAVSGIMANIRKESNYNPKAKGDSGTSYGLCQWHNARWTALKNFCTVNGFDVNAIPSQIDFLLYEMEKSYSTVYTAIMNQPDTVLGAGEVAYIMCKKYEIPANAEQSAQARKQLAYTLFDEYKGAASTAPAIPSDSYVHYIIQPGDTVSELAEKYGCTIAQILSFNPEIKNPDKIRAGDTIRIPETIHVEATEKDKLSRIRDGLQQMHDTIETLLGDL